MIRYFVIIDGRVQGVGFRYFASTNASKFSLTGWVKNIDNGMVELEIQGTEDNINNFLYIIKKGNTFIRVDDFSMKMIEIKKDEKKFKIIY